MGRPTKYVPEMCERIIAAGKEGMSVPELASELGVAQSTLYKWAEEHQEFSEAFTCAQDESEAWWARQLRDGLKKAPSEFQGPANLKYMAQRFKGWSEKSHNDVSGELSLKVTKTIVRPGD